MSTGPVRTITRVANRSLRAARSRLAPPAPAPQESLPAEPAPSSSSSVSPPAERAPTVFFHVMKCGGTSVRAGLSALASGEGRGSGIFELDGEVAKLAAGGRNLDNWRFRDALLPYVVSTARPAVVLGHFRYRDRYEQLLGGAHLVTVLREPVDRLVSLYKYRRFKEGIDVPVDVSFEEFLHTPRWRREGHIYVDTFCGTDLEPRSAEAVDAAIANLRRFTVVGFTDDLDGFAAAVSARCGRTVRIPRLNLSPAPALQGDIALEGAMLELARDVCRPDLEVYEAARRLGVR